MVGSYLVSGQRAAAVMARLPSPLDRFHGEWYFQTLHCDRRGHWKHQPTTDISASIPSQKVQSRYT